MKKKTKKLVLAKETVRTLAGPGLAGVLGAAFTDGCTESTNGCPHTADITCNPSASCGWTCACQSNQAACPGSLCGNTCSC